MTSIIVKVLPRPETEETIFLRGIDDATAISVMSEAMQSPADVSAGGHVPSEGTYLVSKASDPQSPRGATAWSNCCSGMRACSAKGSRLRCGAASVDVKPFWSLHEQRVWRLSVTPTEGARIAAAITEKTRCRPFL